MYVYMRVAMIEIAHFRQYKLNTIFRNTVASKRKNIDNFQRVRSAMNYIVVQLKNNLL